MKGDSQLPNFAMLFSDEPQYEDGTNIARGTPFRAEPTPKTLPWYNPVESNAPSTWKDRWLTLRNRFERLIDEFDPVEGILIQSRIPAYGRQSNDFPPNVRERTAILACGGLRSEPARLYKPDLSSLKALFPIKSVKGEPMLNEAGEHAAFRFGVWRYFFVQLPFGYSLATNSQRVPRVTELARDATYLLYRLPSEIAASLWRNWPSGFSKTENSGASLWLDALFELSWQQEPGGPLHSKRSAWVKNCSYGLMGDGLFPLLPSFVSSKPDGSFPHEYGYPLAYYSKLEDFARASVAAIDEIIERENTLKNSSGKRFLAALSFPGEKRPFIREVANALGSVVGRERILYDEYLTAELARPNLDVYLGALYHDHSELLVPFFCAEYERKEWCGLEWRQMRDILKRKESERIMPFRFDDAPLTGLLSIDGYVSIGKLTPREVAELIIQRIKMDVKAPNLDKKLKEPPKSVANPLAQEQSAESPGKESDKSPLARAAIIKKLTELSHGQIEALIATLGAEGIPDSTANKHTRAAKLVKWAERAEGKGISEIAFAARALGYPSFESPNSDSE